MSGAVNMRHPFIIMSVVNPLFYTDQYVDARLNQANKSTSDISKQLTADVTMMNAQWDFDNAWYDAHVSAGAKYDELRDLGINPLSAARSVAGSPQNMSPGSSPTVSATGADSALTSSVGAITDALGAVNAGVQTDLQRQQTSANVANLNSQTANNLAQNPFIAPKMKSEIAKNSAETLEATEHAGALNAQQKAFIAEANLSDKEAAQIEQVMSRYNEVTDAQITNWQGQARLYFEEAKTQQNIRANIDADTVLKGAQTYENYARADLDLANSKFFDQQTEQLMSINKFVAVTGVPMNADNIETLNYYESKGDWDSAERYVNCILDCAANREAGVQSQSLPADVVRSGAAQDFKNTYENPSTFRGYLIKGYQDLWRPSHNWNPNYRNYAPGLTR